MESRALERNLRQLILDLNCEESTGTKADELRAAFILGLSEAHAVIAEHTDKPDMQKLHRGVITALSDFNQRWDTWLSSLRPGDLKSSASKQFHEMLLRFSKGVSKAYRIWLIDRIKPDNYFSK